jgi:NAD(P)-dependent dehydrogenase (short-subunit alcohol dehydrogenase family)
MYKPFDLTGKVALVTGGNSGIGLGMARAVAEAGADVAIWGTNPAKNAAAQAELAKTGRKVRAFVCDVSDERAVETAFAETLRVFSRVDGCFANAGVSGRGTKSFLEMSSDEWRRVLKVNLDGAFFTFRAAARHMVERGGSGALVGTASLAAIEGAPRSEHYAATKGGMISMIRALAVEFARHGVRANAILPGWSHPARLDRDRHDGECHRQREVRRECAAAHSRSPLGHGQRLRRHRRLSHEFGIGLSHRRHVPHRRRLRAVLIGPPRIAARSRALSWCSDLRVPRVAQPRSERSMRELARLWSA